MLVSFICYVLLFVLIYGCVQTDKFDTPSILLHRLLSYYTTFYLRTPLHSAAKDKRSKKQYRRDQTERRQKRIERSKAKGASKDVWGLRREGTYCMHDSC